MPCRKFFVIYGVKQKRQAEGAAIWKTIATELLSVGRGCNPHPYIQQMRSRNEIEDGHEPCFSSGCAHIRSKDF